MDDGMEFMYFDKMGQVLLNKGEKVVFDKTVGVKQATEGFSAVVNGVTESTADIEFAFEGASEYKVYLYDQNGEYLSTVLCSGAVTLEGLNVGEKYKAQAMGLNAEGEVVGYSQVVEIECQEQQSSEPSESASSEAGVESGCVASMGGLTGVMAVCGAAAVALIRKKREKGE